MLTDQEQRRYSRHLLLSTMGESAQIKLKNATVLIAGIAGLGNPAALYLAAAGVGKLILADGDNIELSNLQRQMIFTENDIDQNKAEQAKTDGSQN